MLSLRPHPRHLGIMSIAQDFDLRRRARMFADASAALRIIASKGLGKVKHIDIDFLWTQEIKARRGIEFNTGAGESNPADMMTKGLTRAVMEEHLKALGL